MVGWILFAVMCLIWWHSRRESTIRRMNMANYMLLLVLDQEVYRRNCEAFNTWLAAADGSDEGRLWLAANNAMESAVKNWIAMFPTSSVGVGRIVWEAKHGKNAKAH